MLHVAITLLHHDARCYSVVVPATASQFTLVDRVEQEQHLGGERVCSCWFKKIDMAAIMVVVKWRRSAGEVVQAAPSF